MDRFYIIEYFWSRVHDYTKNVCCIPLFVHKTICSGKFRLHKQYFLYNVLCNGPPTSANVQIGPDTSFLLSANMQILDMVSFYSIYKQYVFYSTNLSEKNSKTKYLQRLVRTGGG